MTDQIIDTLEKLERIKSKLSLEEYKKLRDRIILEQQIKDMISEGNPPLPPKENK